MNPIDLIHLSCGCQNYIDPFWGIQRNLFKCDSHGRLRQDGSVTSATSASRDYYKSLGLFDDRGLPQVDKYLEQLIDPLDEMQVSLRHPGGHMLEVGCGASPYVRLFQEWGYHYTGLDPSHWATSWVASYYDVHTICGRFESEQLPLDYDLIFAPHVLEHLNNSPEAVQRCHYLLRRGGQLMIIIPDDSDQTNPDHLWFYTTETLRTTLSRIGFDDIRMAVRRVVPHENFIYCVAVKP